MSEWHPQIVRVGKIGKHPNADTLSITEVLGNYPVVFKTGEFQKGDLAVYIPIDTVVPNKPEFSFLFNEKDNENTTKRIKASKIRGIFSMGILLEAPEILVCNIENNKELKTTKAECTIPAEGDSVVVHFNLTKWEPEKRIFLGLGNPVKPPSCVTPVYDLEGLRRYADLIEEGIEVTITEKIHGANARYVVHDGQLYVGSHHNWVEPERNSIWALIAQRYDLKEKFKDYPDTVFYGEIYGKVQELRYGLPNDFDIVFFDIYDKKWSKPDTIFKTYNNLNLPTVPLIYRGPFSLKKAYNFAEGYSGIATANHVKEGIVVARDDMIYDQEIGLIKLKLIGEGYLISKVDKSR